MKQSKTRFPVLITCLLVLLAPAWAFALNLGDISLKSGPGEPLEAEIPLSGVSADEQDSLSVGLADVAGFRWAGIEWSPALNRLQFELKRGADGADYIRVHSDEALRTPLLRFLLKVAWSRGRLFREYTLELDVPPDTYGDTGTDVGAQTGASPAAEDDWGDVRAAVRESRSYEVARNDTLWEIARELRPDSSVSIQQMMLALLRTNPDAFSNGNINWLKAGADLWMPSDFEMQALSAAEAFAEVLVQNNVWREARGLPAVDTGWLAGTGTIAVDGGLRLVPVGEGDLEGGSVAAVEPDGASRQQALALANEQVEELSQENIELGDKLTEAETIIEDLKRLVELKDDELAALQAREITEQAEPGPDLSERIGTAYDSAVEALSGPMYESAYNRVRDYWLLALACMALLLAGGLLLRRKLARAPKGFSVPAASVRPDFVKVTRDKKTVDSDEDGVEKEGAGAEELDFMDDVEKTEPAAIDETVSPAEDDIQQAGGDTEEPDVADDMEEAVPGAEDEFEAEKDGLSDEAQAEVEEEDLSDEIEDEEDLVQNKLDLARAYLELDDAENVRAILDEVLSEGNAAQREEARQLLEQAKSG